MIIAGHLQRQPLMMRSQIADDRIPLNREDVDIGMRYRVSALSELFRQRKEKRVGSEIVKEDFQAAFTNYDPSRSPSGLRDHLPPP